MPLQKLQLRAGLNRENTRYSTEGGWYEADKIRFRQGTPEKIGGWTQFTVNTFLGVCRSLWNWVTLGFLNLVGVGTNLKFYILSASVYYDITPIRTYNYTETLTNPFTASNGSAVITVADTNHGATTGDLVTYSGATGLGGNITAAVLNKIHTITYVGANSYTFVASATATAVDAASSPGGGTVSAAYNIYAVLLGGNPFVAVNGSATITVTATAHGAITNDFVTFSGATSLGGNITAAVLNAQYQITVISNNTYTFTASATANATDAAGSPGGGTVRAAYQVNTGPAYQIPQVGWGAGVWSAGTWGTGTTTSSSLQLWNQYNFGQDLIYGPRGAGIYYWSATSGVTTRGINLRTLGDADTPLFQNNILISDASRFTIVFGTNDYSAIIINPMLIRWSDQEDPFTWTPAITNQAGSVTLSHGSQIVAVIQTRQETVVFTDQAVYSFQYLGPPIVWGTQLLGDNISIQGPNAVALASGGVYWMGVDKFYMYDGRVQTLNCDLRRYVFNDINLAQNQQVFASTNEGFNEIWWFYCSKNSTTVDKYVVYNYLEKIWYYGTMARTAWLDSGLLNFPISATYNNYVLNQEDGIDDKETGTAVAISSYISSAEFDIGDGNNFAFVWRVLPDLTFDGSDSAATITPNVTMTLYGMQNAGSGTTSGETASASVSSISTTVIPETFTGQVYTRLRGRQMIMKVANASVGTTWQLGAPRIDARLDGRR